MWWLVAVLACVEPSPCGGGARPTSIDEAFDSLDALEPVAPGGELALSCFLASLERPLGLELTSDTFSAQPAQGFRSPRIFVRDPALTMSVVPVGTGRDLLEFGEAHESGLTLKAELVFPLALPVDREAAFEKTLAFPGAEATGCQVCHPEEIDLGGGRFANTPLRPPDSMIVSLESLRAEHEACDPRADAYRCEMFAALLDHGEVFQDPFPESHLTLTQ